MVELYFRPADLLPSDLLIMEAITCSVCSGRGCSNCHGSGVLAIDERGQQFYVARGQRGEMEVVGPKEASLNPVTGNFIDRFFGFILKYTSEPQDLLWASKILSRRK